MPGVVVAPCDEFPFLAHAHLFPSLHRSPPTIIRVQESEPSFVRNMKLDVLAALVSEENAPIILKEFTRYVKDADKGFVRKVIQAVVRIANALPAIADRCLRGLMALVTTDNDAVVAEAVIAIRQLLQQHPQHDPLISRLAKRLGVTASPQARSAIVWILGEFQHKPRVAAMAPDALRQLAKGFRGEACEVKYQILNLAAKTALYAPESKPVSLLLQYVLELARYDSDYDLRDRARLLRTFMLGSTGAYPGLDAEALEAAGSVIAVGAGTAAGVAGFKDGDSEEGAAANGDVSGAAGGAGEGGVGASASSASPASATASLTAAASATMSERVKAVLLAAKPPPAIDAALKTSLGPPLTLGSLSFMVGHSARGYAPLPEWAVEASDVSLRDPPKEEEPKKGGKGKGRKAADSSSDDDSSSSEDSSDDSDSEGSSSSGSGDSSEEKDSDEEEDSDEDEDSDDSAPKGKKKGKPAAKPAAKGKKGKKDDSDDEEESEEEESDEDESEEESEEEESEEDESDEEEDSDDEDSE